MKNLTAALSFTSAILLSISIRKYISKFIDPLIVRKSKVIKFRNTVPEKFYDSLRNFHPNKGE